MCAINRCAEPPFQGWLFRFAASRPVGSLATGNFNGKWWNDRFFESILPSHRYRGVPEGEPLAYGYGHLSRVPFVSQPHMCLVREMNPPDLAALGHPPSTREGGALQRAFLFPHLCLAYVVQEYISLPPTAARSPPFKGGFSVSPLRGQSVLWQPGTLMGNGGMIDSSNRFCPLTAIAVFPRESTCLPISLSVTGTFWQSVSYVPGSEPRPRTVRVIFDLPVLDIPSPHSRSSPHFGELFLSDLLIWHGYGLAVSLICALNR